MLEKSEARNACTFGAMRADRRGRDAALFVRASTRRADAGLRTRVLDMPFAVYSKLSVSAAANIYIGRADAREILGCRRRFRWEIVASFATISQRMPVDVQRHRQRLIDALVRG